MIRTLLAALAMAALVVTLSACNGSENEEPVKVREVEEGSLQAPGVGTGELSRQAGDAPEGE